MWFHSSHQSIFLLTKGNSRIYNFPTVNCGQSESCGSCMQASVDNDCGWCYSTSSCSSHSQCSKGGKWLEKAFESDHQCVDLAQVVPNEVAVSQAASPIQIHITGGSSTLKRLNLGKFICRFDGLAIDTRGEEAPYGIRCTSPTRKTIEGSLSTRLSLLATDVTENSTKPFPLLKTSVTFFNCSSFTNCTSCSSAPFQCQWCVSAEKNQCQDVSTNTCDPKSTIISEYSTDPRTMDGPVGPSYCPVLLPVKRTMLVPAFVRHHLTVKVANFDFFPKSASFICKIKYDNEQIELPATYVANKSLVNCNVHQFNVSTAETIGQLSVSFLNEDNSVTRIEPEHITLQIFACELLAKDCSSCLSLQANPRHAEYHCRWCSDQCTFSANCPSHQFDSRCDNVRIASVTPLSAPTEGFTQFTITGDNLGYSFEQIRYGIRIAKIPCNPIPELYEVSKKIVCRLEASPNDKEVQGKVEIVFSDSNQKLESHEIVRIVRPVITGFEPNRGPSSGSTKITIKGKNLMIGNNVTVHIGNNDRRCKIIWEESDDNVIKCITGKAAPGTEQPLLVAFDNRVFVHGGGMFHFTTDPTITHITPLSSFASGGRQLFIHGKNFLSIQEPKVGIKFMNHAVLSSEPRLNMEKCQVKSDFLIVCKAPAIRREDQLNLINLNMMRISDDKPIATAQLFFQMDGVESVRELKKHFPKVKSEVDFYPDPLFYKFPNVQDNAPKLQIGNTLVLEGENLNVAADEHDIKVILGNEIICNVTAISMKQLVCNLNEHLMKPFKHYNVKVNVGTLNYSIGMLQRFTNGNAKASVATFAGLTMETLIGCAVGTVLLLISASVFCCLLVRRSRQAKRNYEKVRLQLDSLESNVRTECKLAFAELQTELVGGCGANGVGSEFISSTCPPPMRDFDSYLLNFLFPSMPEHPCRVLAAENEQLDRGLEHFDTLLCNKQFLSIFIRVLENQKSFGVRDRVNVASLLCLAFVNKPDYLTGTSLLLKN